MVAGVLFFYQCLKGERAEGESNMPTSNFKLFKKSVKLLLKLKKHTHTNGDTDVRKKILSGQRLQNLGYIFSFTVAFKYMHLEEKGIPLGVKTFTAH